MLKQAFGEAGLSEKAFNIKIYNTMLNPIHNISFTLEYAKLKSNFRYLLFTLVVMSLLYLSSNHIRHEHVHANLLLPLEQRIPFLAFTTWFYWAALLVAFSVPLFVEKTAHFLAILAVNAISFLFNFLLWIAFPVSYPRPDVALPVDSISSYLYKQLIAVDTPLNSFPSEHVTLMALLIWIALSTRSRLKWPFLFFALIGIVSVLTTKQHSILDIVFGYLAMLFGYLLFAHKYSGKVINKLWPTLSMARGH